MLHELDESVERYNTASRAARELWVEAEQEAQLIGQLTSALLGGGTSAAEVGRALVTVDDSCKPPVGLITPLLTESGQSGDEERFTSAHETGNSEQEVRLPSQSESARQLPAREPCDRTRALSIVRGVRWPSGVTAGTVARALAAEGREITEEEVHGWLKEWIGSGDVASVGHGRYMHTSRNPQSPTLATSEHAPLLLRRAFQVVSGTPLKEMSTRELATALDENVNVIGGELCGMLREVGVTRPHRGKISARYGGTTGQRLPGFKAETLGKAISAYNSQKPRGPQTVDASTEVVRESTQAGVGISSVPDLLARAYEIARAQDHGVIASSSLFAVLQQQRPVFRDSSDMGGQLVRLLAQVGITRPNKGYVRLQPDQPLVLGFSAVTLRQAIEAHQQRLVLA
ncbi:hypothetical protein OHA46_33665 (plasmid) [Streptomyces sp. NBC_00708]|uniref:hypothetical protein n=1 Tax=Streptomyces sp. NBC_01789 TaxID=2975941 RepID=UPI0022527E8D|nr:hypothetical protein [Streptomyces sp. NBC_01789]MCX4451640.1 hypothetical protein [Streptomyces sp. NBC_01789]